MSASRAGRAVPGWPAEQRQQPIGERHPRRAATSRLRFGGVKALTDITLRRARARDPRHHRAQRRRQELDAQLHQRRLPAAAGLDQPARPGPSSHMNSRAGRRDGRRAHVPEPGAVQGHERARQHHDRPQPEDADATSSCRRSASAPAEREETAHASVVERIIDFLEIQAYRKTPVGQLPYGLQKRVDLGRALAMEPQVLLLDEPMAGMNVEEKQDMCRFILDVNDEFGTTDRPDRARHGRGDGHLATGSSSSTTARRSATARPTRCAPTRTSSRPTSAPRIEDASAWASFSKPCSAA